MTKTRPSPAQSFLQGAATIFGGFAEAGKRRKPRTPEDDIKNLRSDWQHVGDDIRKIVRQSNMLPPS